MSRSGIDGAQVFVGLIFAACLILVARLAYLGLSIEFFRTFSIVVLVLCSTIAAIFVIVVVVTFLSHRDFRSRQQQRKEASIIEEKTRTLENLLSLTQAKSKIRNIVDNHIETLARRRLMLVKADHYGIVDASGWNEEVQRFCDKVIRPQLSATEAQAVAKIMNEIFQELIEDRVRVRADEIELEVSFPHDITPVLFEQWCANILGRHGWNTITTKASGDQGADVLADKNDLRIVLQCKLYSSPVGNKAVQEAFAAQRHYVTNASAVVSNAEFTRSARDLANTTGVLLLHYRDLSRLDSLLGEKLGANIFANAPSPQDR